MIDETSGQPTAGGDPPQWRDRLRYLRLFGLLAPTALFIVTPMIWALNQFDRHIAAQVLFWIGPLLIFVLVPLLDLRFGPDRQNPPDDVVGLLENDKYYRYCTYAYIPFQYASVVWAASPIHRSRPELAGLCRAVALDREDRSIAVGGDARRGRNQCRARVGSQEGRARALAVENCAGTDLLRPLLHRAQPRPPRPGGDTGRPGQRTDG